MTRGWGLPEEYFRAFLDSEHKRLRKKEKVRDVSAPVLSDEDARVIIDQYIKTGQGIEALQTLGRRVVKDAKKQRESYVKRREKELSSFAAVCECPACGCFDVHWLTSSGRECKQCEHRWDQQLRS